MTILDILNKLESNNSRLFKESVLQDNINNELLKRVCYLALNPHINFYIRKIPNYISSENAISLDEAIDKLSMLSDRTYTGNQAIEHLTNILKEVSKDDAEVIVRIISKDLRCGVSESTVNKIWNKFIPDFPCMLASAFKKDLIQKFKYPAYTQTKLDGARVAAIVTEDSVEFKSRNGKEFIVNSQAIKDVFLQIRKTYDKDCVIDGEFLVSDNNGGYLDRKTGNGILNRCGKGLLNEKESEAIRAVVWDIIPLTDFLILEKCSTPYQTRLTQLQIGIESIKDNSKKLVDIVETNVALNAEDVENFYNDAISKNQEGIILKDFGLLWENKRSKKQVKMKAELDLEAEVIGYTEGTGKYKGLLGSLECRSGDIEFSVGTGFKDDERNNPSDYIGKIITVKYNEVITDKKTSKKSLFLPVYLETRFDKDSV